MLQLRILSGEKERVVPLSGAKTPKQVNPARDAHGFLIGTATGLVFVPKDVPWAIEEAPRETPKNAVKVAGIDLELDPVRLQILIQCLDEGLGNPPFFKHAGEARALLRDFKAMAKEIEANERESKEKGKA